MEALSTGYRINKAADDAAGFAVSETMNVAVRSMHQASRNADNTVSMIQTAEAALDEIGGILGRMRELAVQSASDGVNDTQRGYIGKEVTELQAEIDRIVGVTEFNGANLIDGTLSAVFQVGTDKADTFTVAIAQDFKAAGIGVAAVTLASRTDSEDALALVDAAIATVVDNRATLGAKQNRLSSVVNNLSTSAQNLSEASGRIADVDVASEMASFTKHQVLQQANTAMLAQANSRPQLALALLG
jgi:flagellin